MYSASEIQAAVEKLLRASIRRPADPLGVPRADVSFGDIQEAAAGVFLLYPTAPYYLVYLGARRLLDSLMTEVAKARTLVRALDAAGRRTMPMENVAVLFDAKSALEELATASGTRDITKVGAYQRFEAHVSAFLSGPAANIKSNGEIVETPEQARKAIPGALAELRDTHAQLVEAAARLFRAIDDYAALNLPALVAQGVLGRSRQVLTDHAQTLDALTSDGKLERLREVTLDVLASKAVVRALGSSAAPSNFLPMNGAGRVYADANHPAIPPSLTSETVNAYSILPDENVLDVSFGGAEPVRIYLPPSITASLDGGVSESSGSPNGFLIGNGTTPTAPQGSATPNNNRVEIRVTNGATSNIYVATLTLSANFAALTTAEQVASDINAALPSGVLARATFAALRYAGPLDIAASAGTQTTASVPGGQATDFRALGVVAGDLVSVSAGANQGLCTVVNVPAGGQLVLQRTAGTFAAQAGALSEIGPPARRMRIACTDPRTQVPAQTVLTVVASDGVARSGAVTLGFAPGLASRCLRSTSRDVVSGIALQTDAVSATTTFQPSLEGLLGRANVVDPFQVSLFAFTARANAKFSGAILTLSGAFAGARVQTGDALVLRSGPNPGIAGVVTAVGPDTITATTMSSGTSAAGVLFDAGPQPMFAEYQTLRVHTGPNQGDYLVEGSGSTPLDVRLKQALPFAGQGIAVQTFTASIGDAAVVFAAGSGKAATQMEIAGSVAKLFFSSGTARAEATSPYVLLPQPPRGLSPGDLLEIYTEDYRTPSLILPLRSVEASLSVILVSTALPLSTVLRFGPLPLPFARIRFLRTFDFASFRARLDAWLAQPAQKPNFFADLNRFINPLLVSSNPTAAQVGAAKERVGVLLAALTTADATARSLEPNVALESVLSGYNVEPLGAVDTLLRTFSEKGSDRAVDLLLEGQFRAFFGLSMDESSYAGAVQSAMREIARQDVPVSKVGRSDAVQGRSLSNAKSPDYEHDQSDIK